MTEARRRTARRAALVLLPALLAGPAAAQDTFNSNTEGGGADTGGGGGVAIPIPIPIPGFGAHPQRPNPYNATRGQVVADAQDAAFRIVEAAEGGRAYAANPAVNQAIDKLRDDQRELPYTQPRPVACLDLMISAWVAAQQGQPALARSRADQAVRCYGGASGGGSYASGNGDGGSDGGDPGAGTPRRSKAPRLKGGTSYNEANGSLSGTYDPSAPIPPDATPPPGQGGPYRPTYPTYPTYPAYPVPATPSGPLNGSARGGRMAGGAQGWGQFPNGGGQPRNGGGNDWLVWHQAIFNTVRTAVLGSSPCTGIASVSYSVRNAQGHYLVTANALTPRGQLRTNCSGAITQALNQGVPAFPDPNCQNVQLNVDVRPGQQTFDAAWHPAGCR